MPSDTLQLFRAWRRPALPCPVELGQVHRSAAASSSSSSSPSIAAPATNMLSKHGAEEPGPIPLAKRSRQDPPTPTLANLLMQGGRVFKGLSSGDVKGDAEKNQILVRIAGFLSGLDRQKLAVVLASLLGSTPC